ncbi:hypothetical protein [Methylocaldum sp.]|uniref:hypothetical protein n=1 Tax=Methylocaldum sp. TaxID=1969727 RepID=UPI002D67E89B|nr:hypothetical protein [Methylocaldum sp.]HYE34372.1 hypothetical protein [Methylocaldum sp.]
MVRSLGLAVVGAVLVLLIQSCAELKPLPSPRSREAACERFFGEMDRLVAEHGVADAGTALIPDFPHLRIDRFLASFVNKDLSHEAYAAWVERLRKLDETARLIEWRNLPSGAATRLQVHTPFGLRVRTAVDVCGHALAERDLKSPARRFRLLEHAKVPDAYSTWERVLGLYPLTRWAIAEGVLRVHRELRRPFLGKHENLSGTERRISYAPPAPETLGAADVARILRQSAANPLGIPEPAEDQLDRLFASFAPIWTVETKSDNDRIGIARIGADGKAYLDVTIPVVYRLASHTRIGRQVLLQLNYLIWFPARPAEGSLDIYAGHFDGFIWRVTLGADGKPLAYDSIHPCGCYYQIFPGEGYRVVQPQDGSEPVLSPTPISRLKPGERLAIRLASRTHFIQDITPERAVPAPATAYDWLDYDELRTLPAPNGRHRSLFDPDGLVRGSERPERFLFWPMGIPSSGAMRQWGTHAIAFLGRRHFDDSRLLEKLLRPIRE